MDLDAAKVLCNLQDRRPSERSQSLAAELGSMRPKNPRFGTAAEVAEYLGVSVDTVYGEARAGRLPAVRIGGTVRGRWLFPWKLLEATLEDRALGHCDATAASKLQVEGPS